MTPNSRLHEALARLNQIGTAITQLGSGDQASIEDTLRLIVESATEVVPGSSAIIYTYSAAQQSFDPGSRVSAEKTQAPELNDRPRPEGIGARAIQEQRRVLSYEEPDLEIHPAKATAGAQAMGCFPLFVAGEPLGALYVYLMERPQFTELELLMLENFVHLTGMTLSLARQVTLAQHEQARKEKELHRLWRASMLISSRSSLKGTLDIILSMALEITEARYGIFRLVDESGQHLVAHAIAGEDLGRPAVEALRIDAGSIMGQVALRREPLMISDLSQEPWRSSYYPLDREMEMRSELAVPLMGAGGRLEGVLNLESPQVNAFREQDRYLLQILATQAVIAIQEVRLLDVLQQVSQLLLTQPFETVLQVLVERACDLLNIPAGVLWLLDGDCLVVQASRDPSLRGKRIPVEGSLAGRVIQTARPYTCFSDCMDPGLAENPFPNSAGSALMVPLLTSEESAPVGVFAVYSAPEDFRDFDQSEWYKKVLNILGQYAVMAEQYRSHQDMLRFVQEQRTVAETFAAVGDIATNLLHSLNNRIGTIPVRVEGIQDKCADTLAGEPYLARNLEEIGRSATEAMEIMRESLFHLHPIELAPVNVAACVAEAMRTVGIPPDVQLKLQGVEALPAVLAGQRRLVFVFANLLENAVAAMRGRGLIEIIGADREDWIEVSLRDTGPGIDPSLHERIFEFDYSTGRGERPGKLGFGLWWVKTLMTRFGGRVSVESDGISGTTFVLSFPLKKEAA